MSISYNGEISNCLFINDIGDKNLEDINNKIKQLMAVKTSLITININNNIYLKVLNKRKLEENVDIKFLPFLPKEVNALIRKKININMYEELYNYYSKLIISQLHKYQHKRLENITKRIIDMFDNGDFTNEKFRHIARDLFWTDFMNTDLYLNNKLFDYKLLENLKIEPSNVDEIQEHFLEKINLFLFDICVYNNDFKDMPNQRKILEGFEKFNKITILMCFKNPKSLEQIFNASIKLEIEMIKRINKILQLQLSFNENDGKTEYWYALCPSYNVEKMSDELDYWDYDKPFYASTSTSFTSEQMKKYSTQFIDKRKIAVFNKNGKIQNSSNYKIAHYDIYLYIMNVESYNDFHTLQKMNSITKYMLNIFINYYITEQINFTSFYDKYKKKQEEKLYCIRMILYEIGEWLDRDEEKLKKEIEWNGVVYSSSFSVAREIYKY